MLIEEIFAEWIRPEAVLGLVGVGSFGEQLRRYASERGMEVLLCDPPRAALESEEEWENTCESWGNGMGGKLYAKEEFLTFLPLDQVIKRASVLCIQVPENTVIFTEEKIKALPAGTQVLNFSGNGIFAPEALPYRTDVCFPDVSVNFSEKNPTISAKKNKTPNSSR